MAEKTEVRIVDFQINETDAVVSIENLTKANKALREERNKLNLTTQDGVKRAQEINGLIDRNTSAIKANSSALEKNRLNVGNYSESIKKAAGEIKNTAGQLDALAPGLSRSIQGFQGMTTASKALIATPIGALLAAVAGAVALITAAISKSEPALDFIEDVFTKITTTANTLIENLSTIGKFFGNILIGDLGAAGEAFGSLTMAIEENNTAAQKAIDLARELEDLNRLFVIDTAGAELAIKALIIASKNRNLTLEEQNEKLEQAIKLEGELTAKRTTIAQKELDLAIKNAEKTGDIRRGANESLDDFVRRASISNELEPELANAIANRYAAFLKAEEGAMALREKVQNQQDAIAIKVEERDAKEADIAKAKQHAKEFEVESFVEGEGIKQVELENTLGIVIKTTDEEIAQNDKLLKKKIENAKKGQEAANKEAEKQKQIDFLLGQQKLATASYVFGESMKLMDKESAAYKLLAISQASIDTYRAATAALAPPPIGAGPLFGPILAAVSIGLGLANIAKIMGFAEGGYTGHGGKYEPAGVVHRGEVVWSQADVNAVGGPSAANAMRPTYADGGIVASSMSSPSMSQMQPKVILTYSEFKEFGDMVEFKDSIATA